MSDTPISVTDAARNFADCINRARYQDASFVLLRNGLPVARITPHAPAEKSCAGGELAAALKGVRLSQDEKRKWRTDLEEARKSLAAPEDAWR